MEISGEELDWISFERVKRMGWRDLEKIGENERGRRGRS